MPSLRKVSFAITQRFDCRECSTEWSCRVEVPLAGRNCREHTTIATVLKKSLHASGSTFYGNIGIEDILFEDPYLMQCKLKECQGVIELQCKPNHSSIRTCSDCIYKTTGCCDKEQQSMDSQRISKFLLESLDSGGTGEDARKSSLIQHSLSHPGPLDENENDNAVKKPSDYSITQILAKSPQGSPENSATPVSTAPDSTAPVSITPVSTTPVSTTPVPAPRKSLSRSTSQGTGTISDQTSKCTCCSDCLSNSTITTDDSYESTLFNDYEHPVPPQPPPPLLPPKKENNIFHHSIRPDEIRGAMRLKNVPRCYAVVELEVKFGPNANTRTPYVIICPDLKEGHKVVYQTKDDNFFIHKSQQFQTLKDLLSHYRKHHTGCGVLLANQLTKRDFQFYRRHRLGFHGVTV